MNEWEFTADVASWLNAILTRDRGLPFSQAKCEQQTKGSAKRRDLTLLDQSQGPVLTGEVKLPYQEDGGTPYISRVVTDARRKAQRAGAKFFFTWNVNEFVLWETAPSKTSWQDQNYKSWYVANVHREGQLEHPMVLDTIKDWLVVFLNDFAKILLGTIPIGHKLPDEKFIEALDSSLRMPINLNLDELCARYKKAPFRAKLDQWMREEQGWIIYDDPDGVQENLERAARFACYGLVNKLVFYEALLKRYGVKMDRVSAPTHITEGEELRLHLESYFAQAKRVTGDYETVFGETHQSVGNLIPFYANGAVVHWRQLIEQIHLFDFSKLDYEVIGNMCERLLSPEERHKYGQFYTRVEVVDLINSFCIRTGNECVMDPACGGGTFLVRAYARKRELSPERKHGQLLKDIFGVDISNFATHMTTINLATRDLIDDENYPQIARSDFFNVEAQKAFLKLPTRMKTKGLGADGHRDVEVPALDAVVGNPPYVRQEDIPKSAGGKNPPPGTKDYYRLLANREAGANLSARSDVHCYFWPHASSFLKPDGYLCLITSSQWLDVEYGFRLQDWILQNFEVISILESIDEPWFVGARVATAVTILRRQADVGKRMDNMIRFVQLRRPIAEILAHDGTTAGAVGSADAFRDEILGIHQNTSNERYRARLVPQGDLWTEGVRLGVMMGKSQENTTDGEDADLSHRQYYGGKWGVFLRAPDLWFKLVDDYGSRLAPLGNIAEVRFGVKSGKDCFFFPINCSEQCLADYHDPTEFEATYGVPRKWVEIGKVKLVLCGEGRGEIRPIEAEYLEPEVHSLMEVDGFTVAPEDCSRLILLVSEGRNKLKGKHVLDYIQWGEKQGYHKGSTVAARASENHEWYDLTGHRRGELFWPKAQQYKHAVPINDNNLQCNCNLYDIHLPSTVDLSVMAGVLNSSLAILSKFQYGRPVGVEGNLKTEVVDVNMMLVPDPTKATPAARQKVAEAFEKMKGRKALFLLSERRLRLMSYRARGREAELEQLSDLSELDMPDRLELDDAVLQLMGIKSKKVRDAFIGELYAYLREFFEWTRQKEEKAIVNKNKSKRRGPARPEEVAAQIHKEILDTDPALLRQYDPDFIDRSQPFDVFDLPADGVAKAYNDIFVAHGVEFVKGKKRAALISTKIPAQDELVVLVANSGVRGLVRIPHEDGECRTLLRRFGRFIADRDGRIRELVINRTADEDMQARIMEALQPLLTHHG